MRFMTMVKAAENQGPPPKALMDAITEGGEEQSRAGVLVEMGGLTPSAMGARVRVSRGKLTVIDGPFTEAKEIVAGYWLWQCRSLDEAVEWVKRIPVEAFDDGTGRAGEVEIRQVYENEDFGENLPDSVRESEARLREEVSRQQQNA